MQRLFVVSHTHWDREWYEPFQVYRARLIHCVDVLLDIFAADPDYRSFLLDGQTVILEDYLEVRPDRELLLRDLVKAGRLQIGPWYVLPDEFLVSGEAILRNLVRGLRIARDFGDTQPVGYIPDPFGHISQMPQLLRGLNIDTAVFRRGLADEPNEITWQAPDGSHVLACYLRDGYDNAAWLGHDRNSFVGNMEKAWRSLAPHALTPNILLLNGNDHMEPWADLSRLLQAARQQLTDVEILHASLPMFISQVRNDLLEQHIQLDVVRGELRNPKRHHMLPGVTSTRMWIKQRNARAQMLLEKWAEPFAAFAHIMYKADERSSTPALVQLAWKYLLQNHPHDSICGCGIDQTHTEMGLRFDWVEQIIEPLIAKTLSQLAAAVDTQAVGGVPVVVFNPGSGPRTDRTLVQVELPVDWEGFILKDDSDLIAPFQIRSKQIKDYYHKRAPGELLGGLLGMVESGRIMGMAIQNVAIFAQEHPIRVDVTLSSQGEPHPALQGWQQQLQNLAVANPAVLFEIHGHSPACFEIEFVARGVPGYGYRTFTFTKSELLAADLSLPDRSLFLENEFYRVEPNLEDGTVTITDKTTGQIYSRLNRLVDGGDRGDLYNYCPPENDQIVRQPATLPCITSEKNVVRQSLNITMIYRLPQSLTADRSGRSLEIVDVRIETVMSLYPGVRRIDFRTRVENQARDHRLQIEFPMSISAAHVDAEQAFDVVRRPIDLPRDTKDWIEQPRPEAPFQNFVSISDGSTGLTLVTRGLPEYQAQRDDHGCILFLTLLRCIGWLSRDDLTTRSGHAGPALETPGAQEIGVHDFEYSLIPAAGDWRAVLADAHAFVSELRAVPTGTHYGPLPLAANFVDATPEEFVISAIKPADEGIGLIVRGYNSSEESLDITLRSHQTPARVHRVNLIEEDLESLQLSYDNRIRQGVSGKEVVTFKIEF